jgi:hypothetical protein
MTQPAGTWVHEHTRKLWTYCSRNRLWVSFCLLLLHVALAGCQSGPDNAQTPATAPRGITGKGVAIVVSSGASDYGQIGRLLSRHLNDRARTFTLTGEQAHDARVVHALKQYKPQHTATIGFGAAQAAASAGSRRAVTSMVLPHDATRIPVSGLTTISAIPPPSQLFWTWNQLDPKVRRIAVITGDGWGNVVTQGERYAATLGISLTHVVVRNDKEFLYEWKRLGKAVQGYWLLPDNRVLSRDTLRAALVFSVKEGHQVAGFSKELLGYGVLFSAEVQPADVARQMYRALQRDAGVRRAGRRAVELTRTDFQINSAVVRHFGLNVPGRLQGLVDDG